MTSNCLAAGIGPKTEGRDQKFIENSAAPTVPLLVLEGRRQAVGRLVLQLEEWFWEGGAPDSGSKG